MLLRNQPASGLSVILLSMGDSRPVSSERQRGLVHATLWFVAALGLFLLVRPRVNAIAASYELTSLDEEVIGTAIAAAIALVSTTIAHGALFLAAGAPRRSHVRKVVKRMRQWLFSLSAHWGPRRSSENRTIANTAEGLMATLRSNDDTASQVELSIVKTAIQFIVRHVSSNGLPSVSLNLHTVHCTAMGLFVMKGAIRAGRYGLSNRAREAAAKLARSLKRSCTQYGWGFVNTAISTPAECRVFSSLWALRALNVTPASTEPWFSAQFAAILRYVPSGRFGFHYDDEPRTSMMSLFLVTLYELENVTLRRTMMAEVDIESILREILHQVLNRPWDEIEEYNVEGHGLGVEKLAWSHVSIALAVHALSVWSELLGPMDLFRLGRIVRRLVRDHVNESGYYREHRRGADVADPLMYPTSYLIVALQAWSAEVKWRAGR